MTGSVRPLPKDYRWPSGLPWYIGELASPRLEVLAGRLGLPIERYEAEGLGPTIAAAGLLPSGVAVLLTEHEHAVECLGSTGPMLEVDATEAAAHGTRAIFQEALATFGLDQSNVAHEPPPESGQEAEAVLARVRAAVQEQQRPRAES